MRTDDMYPSTFDCALAPIAGAQEDLTLACMKNARERIVRHHTRDTYVNAALTPDGKIVTAVCAVGAVLAEDGFTSYSSGSRAPKRLPVMTGRRLMQAIEQAMSQEAREAIALLNEAALELHPEAETHGFWSGPLEWVNQEWRSDEMKAGAAEASYVVKEEVIRIYDHAIAKRQGAAVVA